MYQSNTKEYTEEDFKTLTEIFEETVTHFALDEVNIEFDMSKDYVPTHACSWNKVDNINKPCKIIQKNSKLALVEFYHYKPTKDEDFLQHLYRIGDLLEQ